MLLAEEIQPGYDPSYQLCKTIWLYHPLGAKIVESPVKLAMSQQRKVTIGAAPEDMLREAFLEEWAALRMDAHIFDTKVTSRAYGVATLAVGAEGVGTDQAIDPWTWPDRRIYFSTFDPLNTSGSLVTDQMPNAPDFQKVRGVTAGGQPWHRSRTVVVMNESPIYIAYTTSAFGYVGRSAYQRILFPLKSFVQTMIADDMVSRKCGLIVAKIKPPGSTVDNLMKAFAGLKRIFIKQGVTNQVLNITPEEDIESLNLQNIDGPLKLSRQNILENIATGAPMPVKLITQESFVEGFGEGTEDAKYVAHYIDGVREEMANLYAFADPIVMHRAWNPEFYRSVQQKYPDYENVPYRTAFYQWRNGFQATWPSLLTEPESEAIKVDETRFKTAVEAAEVFLPNLDPANKAKALIWLADTINERRDLFPIPLELDPDALEAFLVEQKENAAANPTAEEPPAPRLPRAA
jgi:hypothetical protein